MNKVELSVIIVSWNVRDLLAICLRSLLNTKQQVSFEIIVVDNASTDGTVEMLKKEFSTAKLITNDKNFGFAAACHQGVALAQGEYFLFLNDDTEVFDQTLDLALARIKADNKIGVLGCQILNPDKSIQPSVRNFPSLFSQLIILTKLHNVSSRLVRNYLVADFNYQLSQSVDQIMGAFFLTPSYVWQSLGGFDKKFYIWFEEVDYCLRAKTAGYDVYYISSCQVMHHGGASFSQLKAWSEQRFFNRSLLYYARKHWAGWQVFTLRCFLPVSWLVTQLVALLDVLHLNPKTK